MAESFDISILTSNLRAQLGDGAGQMRLSPIRTGKHNASYWVECPAGRFVLRIAPADDTGLLFYERRMMRQEPALHRLIGRHTAIPAAEVVLADFSRAHIDRDYMLLRALPGIPLSEASNLGSAGIDRALRQVGAQLRQLHALTAPDCLGIAAHGYIGDHHPMEPQPTWLAAFGVMWNKLLDDVVACGAYTPAEGQALRDLLDRHSEHFGHLVTPSLLHMDVWGQNILVDGDGTVTGLVDFDRALWGDVEIEFAVLDYCQISTTSFWEGYGMPRDQSRSARTRRVFYLLYEIQKYMPIQIWRRGDPAGAARYKQQSLAMAAALAKSYRSADNDLNF